MTHPEHDDAAGSFAPGPCPNVAPSFQRLNTHPNWRTIWTHIVAGQFSDSPYSGLLFYDQSTGYAEFYETDGQGGIGFLGSQDDLGRDGGRSWRWTHVVADKFSGTGRTDLLLYDQVSGFAAVYSTDGHGNLVKLQEYSDWRTSWTHIATVRVPGSDFAAVVLYDQSAGHGEIFECIGSGKLSLRQASDGWRKTWTHVVGSYVGGGTLLFYEATTGHCEIYTLTYDPSDPNSDPNTLGTVVASDDVPSATHIIPGSFGGDQGLPSSSPGSCLDAGFLFYNRPTGTATFVLVAYCDNWHFESYPGIGATWDIIVPGGFWVEAQGDLSFLDGGFSDLLFYDRQAGRGDFYLHEPPQSTPCQNLAGYASTGSLRPGETIDFFVSSRVGPYTLTIYRQTADLVLMADIPIAPSAVAYLPIRRSAYRVGAQWPAVASLQVPAEWPSGLYLARIESGEPAVDIAFIVRAPVDGTQSKILVAMNDTTYEAYNFWGGRSLYGFGSLETMFWTAPGSGEGTLPWGFQVSFRRPPASFWPQYQQRWTYWEAPLARWLARQGIAVEWCTLVDIHNTPNLLDQYALVVNVGHAEYVSNEIHDQFVRFVARGGNAAFFGGNNCWWRVRIEDGGDTMVCYKDAGFDPVVDDNEKTINWPDALAAKMTGVSWSGNALDQDPTKRTNADGSLVQYVVRNPGHWALADTSMRYGQKFGLYNNDSMTIVGSETDVSGNQSPPGFETIANVHYEAPGTSGWVEIATMGVFTTGGTVFTASTNDWTLGLRQDSRWGPIDQITLNVFNRLGSVPPPQPTRIVPDLYESSAAAATKALRAAGLVPYFANSGSWVESQEPIAGSVVAAGATVKMTLRSGPMP
jgi:hypothetical protein